MTIFGVTVSERYRSRKFLLAASASVTAHIALFTGEMDGGTWVAAQTLILGLYSASDITEHKINVENQT